MNKSIKITNLSNNYPENEILETFSAMGNINEIKYGKNEVIVQYSDENAVKNSMMLNSVVVGANKITIETGE